MFKRQIAAELLSISKQYPVVTLTGPRQSGKTTIVKEVFPNKPYANLESLNTFELANSDPIGFLDKYPEGAIFDEIQKCPKLLSEIQVRVDQSESKGLFILTGSHQVGLRGAIAQSLAGRTAILHLLPMSIKELSESNIHMSLDEYLLQGGYPRIFKDSLNPTKSYSNYVQTYIERDLRQMIEVKNLGLFQKFIKLCAGRIGQVFNKASISNEVGVSSKTISQWISILEASYLIFLLPPYYENFGKRAIKSPKLYFTDVGLATYLLGIENISQLERDPLRGNLVENLVLLELVKARWNEGLEHKLFFYRDSNQNEVDILYQRGHELTPIEVKSAKTFNASFLKGLTYFKNLAPEKFHKPYLVYAGVDQQEITGVQLLNIANSSQIVEKQN